MRTILGAVIGLALGIALIAVLAVSGGWDGYWTMIPVGLVVGVAMRAIASSGNASIGRGVLALLAAMGAMPLGQMVSAQIIRNQEPSSAATASVLASEDGEAAPDAEGEDGEASPVAPVQPVVVADDSATAPGGAAPMGVAQPSETSPVDIVCLVIGALLSYQIGKGPETVQAEPSEEEGEGDSPPEGGDAPADGDSGEES